MLAPEQVIRFPHSVSLTELARPCMSTFFRDAHWGQCLELVSHLCQHGKQALVVVGPTGIGKTSMKYALENRQINNVHIVDDAHNLSLDQIMRLLYEQDQRVVLLTRPELLTRIKQSVLHGDFMQRARIIEIEPLTFKEMTKFLQHQWEVLGHIGVIPTSKAELQKIYAVSKGIPGKVKQLFTDSLRGHDVLNTEGDAKNFSPILVGLVVACGIAACLLALMWPLANKQQEVAVQSEPLPQSSLVAQIPSKELEFDQMYDTPQESHEAQLAKLEEKLGALQQQLDLEEQDVADADIISNSNMAAVDESTRVETIATVTTKPASQSSTQAKSVTKPVVSNTVAVAPQVRQQGNSEERLILARNNKHYALQLVAASNEQRVRDFITRNKLSGKAHYYTGTRNGKPWYTVVYGDFPNKTAALADIGTLPNEVKKLGPWVRQYSSIKTAIQNNLDHG